MSGGQGIRSAGDRRQRRDRDRPGRGLDDDRRTRSCSPAARPRPGAPRRKWSPPAPRSRAPSPRACGSRPTPPTSPSATSSSRRSSRRSAPKGELLARVAEACPNADLATTTSSLGIAEIAEAGGISGRLFGLHVFNPVPRMKLVEVCFPDGADARPREGARLVRGARQDRGRGPRPGRLRRQPPALPLPLRRRPLHGTDRHGGRARSTPA